MGIYDTPSTNDEDPSMWVLGAFGLFFAFIIGDGGYGLIYLAICLGLLWKYPHVVGMQKRMLHLGIFLSSCCIAWGIISGSFFGVMLPHDNVVMKYSPINWLVEKKAEWLLREQDPTYLAWVKADPELAKFKDGVSLLSYNADLYNKLTDNIMLELALFIGVIHSLSGMIRYLSRRKTQLGWIIFLVGAYLYFPLYLGVPSLLNYGLHLDYVKSAEVGLYMIYSGIAIAISIAIYEAGVLGLTEAMKLIEVFADVLSYLRLYALGLAGGIVAAVINDASDGMPVILGILLGISAHGINMVMGIMSGVIHGLRLNFIEWYHYSFEGGGKKFKPLIKLNKELI